MATSSILEKIRVNNPKVIEEFVAAMDRSAENPVIEQPKTELTTDPDMIRKILVLGTKKQVVKAE